MALFAIDLAPGARLQLNTLFGYSTAVAGRFAGLGNLAFGFLAAATLLLAVTVWEAFDGRRGLYFAIAILTVGVLLDGLPMLGGDVGGALAMVPAFGLAAMVLAGRRVRLCHVVAWCPRRRRDGAAVRPARLGASARRTDAPRSIHRTRVRSWGRRDLTVLRATVGSQHRESAHRDALDRRAGRRVRGPVRLPAGVLRTEDRGSRAGRAVLVGLGLLAVIGLVSNDSGIAVPGVMLAVAVPVAVLRSDAWLGTSP